MTNLSLSIEKLKNVGTRNAPRLQRLGIKTLKDLLWHLPARYENYSETVPISDISPNQKVNIQGEVIKITTKKLFPRRMFITDAIVKDLSGAVQAVWFNQPFIANQLSEGTFVSLAGKVKVNKNGVYLASPTYEKLTFSGYGLKHTKGLVPVYPETEGITSKYLRFLIKPLVANLRLKEALPETVIKKYNFPSICEAIKTVHFPDSEEKAQLARERLAFGDLMLFQIKALLERRKASQLKSVSISFNEELIKNFIAGLPFELTKDQKIASWEILKDLEKKYPMNRLMEGDVGSGKTVVALVAALEVVKAGHQVTLMAPTEVLAQQHYATITALLGNPKSQIPDPKSPPWRDPAMAGQTSNSKSKNLVKVGLLTSSMAIIDGKEVKKTTVKNELSKGEPMLLIGTHAVIQKDVSFGKLVFVILDEQHRFGVQQRAALVKNKDYVPHLLSMTATPIPRTLALTIYGDLDISVIKEKPKNRQKIVTKVVDPSKQKDAYTFIREEVGKGRQVFVVCPRIEVGDPQKEIKTSSRQSKMNVLWADVKAVEEEYKKLSGEIFPDLKVAMLHGKMKSKEKQEIMSGFKDGKHNILVSTSVIEVGVDVPNATIMMVGSAERFGLAQLHQFRGRVGRGEHQSHCLLFASTNNKTLNRRLKALVDCDDGFELAEKDMAIRGPGEFMGTKQSGIPDLAMASLANIDLIKKARTEARLLLKEDPSLSHYPLLREQLTEFQKMTHFE